MIIRVFLIVSSFLFLVAILTDTDLNSFLKDPASQASDEANRTQDFSHLVHNKKMEIKPSVIMNDPVLHKNWGISNSKALDAWQLTQGSRDIIVAIVDTGIDVNHPDIKNNLWVNPGESGLDQFGRNKATNGIDDDGNGFIDDVHGWNFVHNNNHVTDNHGHGTHIAGIVGAEGGNGIGITGIAPKVSLMILKYYDPQSAGNNLANTIKAFDYATKMNAHIINYSGGGTEYSKQEFEAVKRSEQKGILFVAAAGNEHSNSDVNKYYPADYDLDNIISVTAIDPEQQVLATSNYGVRTVDIAAPGENIYSTYPGSEYEVMTGTSQATAFVSGVAALLMAHNRDFDGRAVRKYILRTGDELDWLQDKTKTSKKLNVYRALTMLDQGVGASGVIGTNTSTPEANFSGSPTNDDKGSSSLNDFANKLKKALDKSNKKPASN